MIAPGSGVPLAGINHRAFLSRPARVGACVGGSLLSWRAEDWAVVCWAHTWSWCTSALHLCCIRWGRVAGIWSGWVLLRWS